MPIDRSKLVRGPGHITFDGATILSAAGIVADFIEETEEDSQDLGATDEFAVDRRVEVKVTPKQWQDLAVLFPHLSMVEGDSLFSATDKPLVIAARNGDKLTVHNARVMSMSQLTPGVKGQLFSEVTFVGLIKNGSVDPEDANSYYTFATGQVYTEVASIANIAHHRYSVAWGAVAPWDDFQFKAPPAISWNVQVTPDPVDSVGMANYVVEKIRAELRGVPVGPLAADIEAAIKFQGTGARLGALKSALANDLVLTGANSGPVITLVQAHMASAGMNFSKAASDLRQREVVWRTTTKLAGVNPSPQPIATLA